MPARRGPERELADGLWLDHDGHIELIGHGAAVEIALQRRDLAAADRDEVRRWRGDGASCRWQVLR